MLWQLKIRGVFFWSLEVLVDKGLLLLSYSMWLGSQENMKRMQQRCFGTLQIRIRGGYKVVQTMEESRFQAL